MQIGGKLKSGKPHDGRAPDYDDWALNCDILFWHKPLGCALELSSMGIRVNAESLRRQLEQAGCPQRAELPFHKMLLDGTLPLTMGGGIGQSRLCMLLLGKAHVGEVQVSLWDDDTVAACEKAGHCAAIKQNNKQKGLLHIPKKRKTRSQKPQKALQLWSFALS